MAEKTCCCSLPSWADGQLETPAGKVIRTKTVLSSGDRTGTIRCRLSDKFRSKYRISSGLYATGNPTPESEVLVTANYKMSFDEVRKNCAGLDAWLLVLDTKGINVWCAAGKGTFGTKELVNRMRAEKLENLVTHRRIILPQLGASGVSGHEVTKATGFSVVYGPVRATDIREFLKNGRAATAAMRRVTFSLKERLALVPMELFPALKWGLIVVLVLAAVMGLRPGGILFQPALSLTTPLSLALLCAIVAGSVLHPLLLPFFPMRAFTIQGALLGLVVSVPFMTLQGIDVFGKTAIVTGISLVSSYLAFNFTGCTTYTNKSGVKKELTRAWPFYLTAAIVVLAALVAYKLKAEGVFA